MGQTQNQQYVVIVAGGTGTRLWPLSRKHKPKQFLDLLGEGNFLSQAFKRACAVVPKDRIYIVAPDGYSEYLLKYLPDFSQENFMGEPEKKGTTAAFGYTATYISSFDPEATLHIVAADDYLVDNSRYSQTLHYAADIVNESSSKMIIYGVKPQYPNTGYGYIKVDPLTAQKTDQTTCLKVVSFHEKPDLVTASEYLKSSDYYWHCFGFTIKASSLLNLISVHDPKTYDVLTQLRQDLSLPARKEKPLLQGHYHQLIESNIENKILEHNLGNLYMVTLEDTWSDVGSWEAVYRLRSKDENSNAIVGDKSKVIQVDSTGNLVATSGKPIVLAGANNLAVIDTGDIILITPLDQSQKVKQAVAKLKESKLEQYL